MTNREIVPGSRDQQPTLEERAARLVDARKYVVWQDYQAALQQQMDKLRLSDAQLDADRRDQERRNQIERQEAIHRLNSHRIDNPTEDMIESELREMNNYPSD
jgi:hypothetical protein